MSNFGDWLPGAKDAKMRADAVIKRRSAAAALTTDLDLELQDLQVSLQLDQKDYQPGDLSPFRSAMERAQAIMSQIYNDVTLIADKPVPERITEFQAFEFIQPALRIETRAGEVRQWFAKARQARDELNKPRGEANGSIAEAERRRLKCEIDLAALGPVVEQLKAAYAENYPQVSAAFATSQSEVMAASQMVTSARQALQRRSWREANDLAKRATSLFASAEGKFAQMRTSEAEYSNASQEADDALAEALRQLKTARATLESRAGILANEPGHYLDPVVQRVGEARRAYKATPPQYVSALRLAKEALAMLDQALSVANAEVQRLYQARQDARQNLTFLNEAVTSLRVALNEQRSVPVKANESYTRARDERDRLYSREAEIDALKLPQLVDFTASARAALQLAQEGLKLVEK